jgi:hypothetical protein
MTDEAMKRAKSKAKLTRMDWKFFFFGWYDNPLCQLQFEEAKTVPITKRFREYFAKVEAFLRRPLPVTFKAWYIKKESDQGELMFREHPSTPAEAFMKSIKGVYYASQFLKLRADERICDVPHIKGYPVDTWWDLGFNDVTSIWFVQTISMSIHVINYFQGEGEGLGYYAEKLREMQDKLGYQYGRHWAPHDISVHDYSIGRTRQQFAEDFGIRFERVDRLSVESGIEAVRKLLPYCVFDIKECDKGIKGLESYRKEWDEKKATYRDRPYHDWASNPADAFRTGAVAHPLTMVMFTQIGNDGGHLVPTGVAPNPRGWT